MDESQFIFDPNEVDSEEEAEYNINAGTKDTIGDIEDAFMPPKSNYEIKRLDTKLILGKTVKPTKKPQKKTFADKTTKKFKPNVEVETEYEYNDQRELQNE